MKGSAFLKGTKKYVYDSTVELNDRAFIMFSAAVLVALFLAIPCGLIMHEPLSATISTAIGAVLFTIYVFISIKRNTIARAKIVLSIVVIFIFLPTMFFTNGGVYGGTPVWLLLGTIYISMILNGKLRIVMMIMNALVLMACYIVGYYYPGLVTEYTRGGNFFDSISALYIVGGIIYVLVTFQISLFKKEEESKNLNRLFEQTATALVNAIDAKDKYTHGHSSRVAEYSKKIAELSGKSPAECKEIYYVALLHDVGKIGIPESIINKEGKLTNEEYEIIKQHPKVGAQILRSITEYPDMIIGARYHHERYDGKGYPDMLKGEDIPEIARIISVADAYDAMTSKRSYRSTLPQQSVREEIVKGSGTQFDPEFAKIMQNLIDMDVNYDMREKDVESVLSGKGELYCKSFEDEVTEGIHICQKITKIRFRCELLDKEKQEGGPSLIIFDSIDARFHDTYRTIMELSFLEYGVLKPDGRYECNRARKISVEKGVSSLEEEPLKPSEVVYEIESVRVKDHAMITIDNGVTKEIFTIAFPDSARFAYIGLTGENCRIYDIDIDTGEEEVPADFIPRIAEEISYIDGPEGDVPSVQIDGYRSDSTEGIKVTDGLKVTYHTKSLPTARLVWHCSYIDLFYSEDHMAGGPGYKEYSLIRLDGENWEADGKAKNELSVSISDSFEGWDAWKEANKKGFECTVYFKMEEGRIITTSENLGISITNITTEYDPDKDVYLSLTGDQVVITNVRIER